MTLFGNIIHLLTFKKFTFSFLDSSRTLYWSYFFSCLQSFSNFCIPNLIFSNIWTFAFRGIFYHIPKQLLSTVLCTHCLEHRSTMKPLVFVLGAWLPRPTWLLYLFPTEHTLGDWWEFGGNIGPPLYSVKSEKSLLNVV